MPVQRVFLDWTRPALPAVAGYLLQRFRQADQLDMSGVLVVVPGARAGRKLSQILLEAVQREELVFLPPVTDTIGVFPEQCYESKRPFADPLTQQLTWVRALRGLTPEQLGQILPRPPAPEAFDEWRGVAESLSGLHRELAAEGLDFASVTHQLGDAVAASELPRWEILRSVQQRYLALLDDLELWDLQTARLYALEHRLCHSDKEIVLVGAVDLNGAVRQMLQQVAEQVTALVLAPESWSDRFDEFGCLRPAQWSGVSLPIRDEQIRLADGPAEQTAEVVRVLASFEGRYRMDEVAVGVPDPRLVPALQRQLAEYGVPTRWVLGRPLPETGPFRLLEALALFLENGRFEAYAQLVRHPDLDRLLQRRGVRASWLKQLDEYQAEHLPVTPEAWIGSDEETRWLRTAYAEVRQLKRILGEEPLPLPEWPERIHQVLVAVYERYAIDPQNPHDRELAEACRVFREMLQQLQQIPSSLTQNLTHGQALRLLLDQLNDHTLHAHPTAEAVELLGWLELPLDLSPALVVTSFNEGFVPSSLNADLFLPNRARAELGLLDNERRYARDAYATHLILASRSDVTVIVGRRDADSNPLIPSRLLFATDELTLAHRALQLFGDLPETDRLPLPAHLQPSGESRFWVPRPLPSEGLVRLRVTAFRSYLDCPYRFYLRHVLNLQGATDDADELSAAAFGTLTHRVLQAFGEGPVRTSTSAEEIQDYLHLTLRRLAEDQFGTHRLPAVEIQLLQLGARLKAFAQWQADHARQGWEIKYTEQCHFPEPPILDLDDGRAIELTGTIDRIDYHAGRDEWLILDYKTSDSASSPEKVHRQKDTWIDLQLPLYRLLAHALGIPGPFQLGYVLLPKDTSLVKLSYAEWSESELQEAEEVAREVGRKILDAIFWPPSDALSHTSDYAALCQEETLERLLEPDSVSL